MSQRRAQCKAAKARVRREFDEAQNPIVFCEIVKLLHEKGIDVTGVILGDGPEMTNVVEYCRSGGIEQYMSLPGKAPNADVYRHIAASNYFVSTSVGEPYGRSIVEAMSVGTPCVCHRWGGRRIISQIVATDYWSTIFPPSSMPAPSFRLRTKPTGCDFPRKRSNRHAPGAKTSFWTAWNKSSLISFPGRTRAYRKRWLTDMFKVWLTTTGSSENRESPEMVARMMAQLERCAHRRYRPATSADMADAIIFIEPNYHKLWNYPRMLLSNPLVKTYPNKCFAHDYTASGTVFLPGAYVHPRRYEYDRNRSRACGYLTGYNALVTQAGDTYMDRKDIRYLFSFRGAPSHSVRFNLLKIDFGLDNAPVRQVDRWFDHNDQELGSYVDEILQSKFVLAPRGIGTSSIRQFEVMQLGRVPVILSDDWVPPMGPCWNEFSIRVAEDRLHELPRIIGEREADWNEMGDRARDIWERYYAPDSALLHTIAYIEDLIDARPVSHDERAYQRLWSSLDFAIQHNWTVPQRVYHKFSRMIERPW